VIWLIGIALFVAGVLSFREHRRLERLRNGRPHDGRKSTR